MFIWKVIHCAVLQTMATTTASPVNNCVIVNFTRVPESSGRVIGVALGDETGRSPMLSGVATDDDTGRSSWVDETGASARHSGVASDDDTGASVLLSGVAKDDDTRRSSWVDETESSPPHSGFARGDDTGRSSWVDETGRASLSTSSVDSGISDTSVVCH